MFSSIAVVLFLISERPIKKPETISEVEVPIRVEMGEIREATREEQLKNGKLIALTFDDGPSEYTEKLLDILKKKRVPATFFVLGSRANAYPDLIKREMDEGNEVESHTMNHKNLATLGADGVRAEITGAEQAICSAKQLDAGCIKFVRPPYGEINSTVRNIVGKPMIGWSIDTEDWKSKNPDEMLLRTITKAFSGAVILMHDVYDTSVIGAEKIIDALLDEGYVFVTIEEMLQQKGVNLPAGSYYGRFD